MNPINLALRFLLEVAVLGAAAFALRGLGRPTLAIAFTILVLLHYAWSYERVAWLVKQ